MKKETIMEKPKNPTPIKKMPSFDEMKSYADTKSKQLNTDARAERRAKRGVDPKAASGLSLQRETWLPVTVVAKRLGISRRRAYSLIHEGSLEAVNFGERLWRVAESELLRFMEQCHRRTQEELGLDLGVGTGRADRKPRRTASV
jgi:excisionase family DNA binding protein